MFELLASLANSLLKSGYGDYMLEIVKRHPEAL